MSVKSGFFNSTVVSSGGVDTYDREYYASDFANYLNKVVGSGVFAKPSNNLQVVASGSGMNVIIKTGEGRINGYWINNDADYSLAITASDVILDRIDRIVMRLDVENRAITIVYKEGTAATTPVAPTNTRTEQIIEYSLAKIYVAKGTETITQAMITDTRPIESATDGCGLIATMGTMESNNYFTQMQAYVDDFIETKSSEFNTWEEAQEAAFTSWFTDIQDEVTATSLYREYSYYYATPTANISSINIPLSINYAHNGLDVINVLVNGMKMVKDVEYSINSAGTAITFTNAIAQVGTGIEIINKKAVEGTVAESTVTRLEALETEVSEIVNNDYEATGTDDNNTLSTMIQNFLSGTGDYSTVQDNSCLNVRVNGLIGIGYLISNQSVFKFSSSTVSNRRVFVDFANATIPTLPNIENSQSILAYFDIDSSVTIKNANISIGTYNATSIYGVHGGNVDNIKMSVDNTYATNIYGVWGAKKVSNSEISINAGNTNNIYGIYSAEQAMFNKITVNIGSSIFVGANQVAVGNILTGQMQTNATSELAANVTL